MIIANALEKTEESIREITDSFCQQANRASAEILEKTERSIESTVAGLLEKNLTEKLSEASEKVDRINLALNHPREMSTRVLFLFALMIGVTLCGIFLGASALWMPHH